MVYLVSSGVQDPDRLAVHFSEFLVTKRYRWMVRAYKNQDCSPDCLLDVIQFWVTVGNATEVCPTFELFLQGVMQIIHQWLAGDQTTVYDYALWPDDPSISGDLAYGGKGKKITHLAAGGGGSQEHDNEPMNHPVLRRENFLLEQANRADVNRRELLAAIKKNTRRARSHPTE